MPENPKHQNVDHLPLDKIPADSCKRCHGTGKVIIALSCLGPHLYGVCPECKGRSVLASDLKTDEEKLILLTRRTDP